jgi:hypothetical protein
VKLFQRWAQLWQTNQDERLGKLSSAVTTAIMRRTCAQGNRTRFDYGEKVMVQPIQIDVWSDFV